MGPSSRQTAIVDANGRRTSYHYDSIGRLLDITYPDLKKESRTWNGDGTMATHTDPNGSVATFTYGPDDQPETIAYTRGAGVVGVTSEGFVYDKLGRMTSASRQRRARRQAHTRSRGPTTPGVG